MKREFHLTDDDPPGDDARVGRAPVGLAPQAEKPFRALLEAAPDAMVIVDGSGTIQLVNAQAESMFCYTRDELLGRNVDILVPERFRGQHGAHRLEYSANGQVRPMGAGLDLYGLRRDRREFPVEISLSPLETSDGLLISAAIRDVSDRKAAEREITQLYEQQRHVALTLQHALMGAPREVPGMASASRYFPATQGAGVGGDWFDLISLGAGRVGVLIGDVMGRGLEAATVMGQLRSAANALARTGMPPRQLMDALDLVAGDMTDQMATCCYLVVDPQAGEVSGCSAGHLPILVASPDATVSRLPIPVSVPLGVGHIPHEQATVPVTASATLVLYTDGLVETHRCDIEQRVAALESELRGIFTADPCLEHAADKILTAMLPRMDEPPDDVTLLLVEIPEPPRSSASVTLPVRPCSAVAARRFVSKTLAEWGRAEHLDTASLLVSEIVTNAVRHAQTPLGLRMHLTSREIITEITDDNTHLPYRHLADPDDENGRGLMLVDALAASWGTRPADSGKTVWFTMGLEPGPDEAAVCCQDLPPEASAR